MIDVKKLVTGFLVLAVAVSASALLVSAFTGGTGTANGAAAGNSGAAIVAVTAGDSGSAGGSGTALSGSAFLPQPAVDTTDDSADQNDPALSSSTQAIMSDPNNLTGILANVYLNNLALTNPSPATDPTGNPTLTPPDESTVLAQFMSSSTDVNLQVPNWDTEADQVPITITSSSPAALTSYGTALGDILGNNIVQSNLQSMLNNNTDPSFEPYVAGKVQTALQDISGLQTPQSAVPLQKSLIKTLVYAKDALALAENADADPLKTELILQAEDSKYQTALQDLQTQIQNAQSQNLFSMGAASGAAQLGETNQTAGSNDILADIQSLVGVPVANAQAFGGVVYDPTNNIGIWATVAQLVEANLKNIALQLVKNAIVLVMQKTIIAAIQNSGAPKFIQQWGTTLANAAQTSALNALNAQMTCVGAAPFAPQVRLTLGATYQSNNNICAVQYNAQLGNNLTKFYNNFSNGGGWVTFGSTLLPDNNYYGTAFFVAQTVGNTSQNAQSAAQARAVANQGFNGTAVCDDGSNPNGNTYNCYNSTDSYYSNTPSCKPGYQMQVEPNNGSCSDGTEPQIQAPGVIASNMLSSAFNGNFSLVTSANSWEGLASGLFISIIQQVMNSLATTVITQSGQLLDQAIQGGGATTVNTSTLQVVQTANSPQPITCYVSPDPSQNPLAAQIMVSGGEVISSTGTTLPSYSWTQPFGGSLSAVTGDTVTATFNASGTYPVVVNDITDSVSQTCVVTIPVTQ